jgi:exonuclease SbcC
VEALHALRDDFDKIIIITHVEELKDAFSSRIEVVKGPGGSRLAVYEGIGG